MEPFQIVTNILFVFQTGQYASQLLTNNPWFDPTEFGLVGLDQSGINLVSIDLGMRYEVVST